MTMGMALAMEQIALKTCESVEGFVPISGDCDDGNAAVYPAADESVTK